MMVERRRASYGFVDWPATLFGVGAFLCFASWVLQSDWLFKFTDQLGDEAMLGIPLLICAVALALGLRAYRVGRRLPGTFAVVAALPGLLVFGFFFLFFVVLGGSR